MFKTLLVIGLVFNQMNSFGVSLLPEFSAVYNSRKKAVVIKWQHASAEIKTYTLQHSSGNKTWTDIALQEVGPVTANRSFYFEDKKFVTGENYYRLKCKYADGKTVYSQQVIVMITSATKSWIIYPVPVTDLLTLEYRGSEPIRGVINIIIQQPSGRIFTKKRYGSLSRQIKIPVDHLPKGIYDIRILVQEEVIWDQRFIK
ncbi:MAG: hypothetical protein WAT20_01570 [Ferruginibacter sp.]